MQQNLQLIKTPPHSQETEQLILGSILVNPLLFDEILLKPEIFYFKQHALIYKSMIEIKQKNITIDALLVSHQMDDYTLQSIGGFDYLNQLVDCGVLQSITNHANVIMELHNLRQAINLCHKFMDKCFTHRKESLNHSISSLTNELANLNAENHADVYSLPEIIDTMMKLRDNKPNLITTNDSYLDGCLRGGLAPGELIILAGRPSIGKTAIAVDIFSKISKTSKVIFFSLEMGLQEITHRLHNNLSGMDIDNSMSNQQLDDLILGLACRKHMYIIDNPYIDIVALRNHITSYKIKHEGIDVIIIDYLQIMKRPDNQKEYEFISNVTRELKLLAKEFKIAIICLSQLSRNGTERRDKRPILADLRGSGSIEQDADIVLFIHREEYYLKEQGKSVPNEVKGIMELIIAKFRRGEQSKLLYHCNLSTNRLFETELATKSQYVNFLNGKDASGY